jgi:hypothetical protein
MGAKRAKPSHEWRRLSTRCLVCIILLVTLIVATLEACATSLRQSLYSALPCGRGTDVIGHNRLMCTIHRHRALRYDATRITDDTCPCCMKQRSSAVSPWLDHTCPLSITLTCRQRLKLRGAARHASNFSPRQYARLGECHGS